MVCTPLSEYASPVVSSANKGRGVRPSQKAPCELWCHWKPLIVRVVFTGLAEVMIVEQEFNNGVSVSGIVIPLAHKDLYVY